MLAHEKRQRPLVLARTPLRGDIIERSPDSLEDSYTRIVTSFRDGGVGPARWAVTNERITGAS